MLVPKLTGFTETAADTAALNNLKQIDKAFTAADIKARVQEGYLLNQNSEVLLPFNSAMPGGNQEYEIRVKPFFFFFSFILITALSISI